MMKRNYLLIALVFGITSNLGFAQTAYVVGNDKVQVNQNTLLYFGDGLTITNGATDASVISSGRSIQSYTNVSTKTDKELKLPANGVYVVKIVADNGDVYTQKIIK